MPQKDSDPTPSVSARDILQHVDIEAAERRAKGDGLELSLQRRQISDLSGAFERFSTLVVLDLSRNQISCLLGLESLRVLRKLSLYFNLVRTGSEILRLKNCPLKKLDMRLNPVAQTSLYRAFVFQNLKQLELLDERVVSEFDYERAHGLPPIDSNDIGLLDSSSDSDSEEDSTVNATRISTKKQHSTNNTVALSSTNSAENQKGLGNTSIDIRDVLINATEGTTDLDALLTQLGSLASSRGMKQSTDAKHIQDAVVSQAQLVSSEHLPHQTSEIVPDPTLKSEQEVAQGAFQDYGDKLSNAVSHALSQAAKVEQISNGVTSRNLDENANPKKYDDGQLRDAVGFELGEAQERLQFGRTLPSREQLSNLHSFQNNTTNTSGQGDMESTHSSRSVFLAHGEATKTVVQQNNNPEVSHQSNPINRNFRLSEMSDSVQHAARPAIATANPQQNEIRQELSSIRASLKSLELENSELRAQNELLKQTPKTNGSLTQEVVDMLKEAHQALIGANRALIHQVEFMESRRKKESDLWVQRFADLEKLYQSKNS